MSELIDMTKVFILESPSKEDNEAGRNEGGALGETLELATIDNEVFTISSLDEFKGALEVIAKEVNEIKGKLGAVHLHFSMHGSDDGIVLTDGTFLDWTKLHEVLKEFNDSIKYIEMPSGLKIAPTFLSFSVCNGFAARAIKDMGDESPYSALIGPTESVEWSDSLLAFSIYFHNVILKKTGTAKALKNMNETVGLDNVFHADGGKGMTIKE